MVHDVLVWGTYFCDLIYSGLDEFPALGKEIYSRHFEVLPGGCFTTAVALHRLGIHSAWACDFGNDFFSQFVIRAAEAEGINRELFREFPFPIRRVTTAFSYVEDRAFVSFVDDVPLTPVLHLLRRDPPRWLVLPHLHYGEAYQELFTTAKQAGARIYMDCQSTPVTLSDPRVGDAIGSADVFAPNAAEALHLTGASSPEDALERLAGLAPWVVIKLGGLGAMAWQGGEIMTVRGHPVEVIDTTGAGDCFNAGFLYGILKGASPKDCLRYANLCGAISTTAIGGRAAPTSRQLEELRRVAEGDGSSA